MKNVEKKVTETKPTAKSLSTEKVETVSTDAKKVELELSQMLGIGFTKTKSGSPTLHEHDESGSGSVISFLQKGAWSTSNKTSVNATEVEPSSSAEKSKTKENDENQEKDETGDWEEVGEPVSVEQKIVFNSSQRGSLNSQPPRDFRQVNYGRGDNFNNYSGRSPRGFMQNSTFRQPQIFVNRGPSYFFGNSSTNPRGMQRGRVGNGYRNQNHEQLLNNSDLAPSAVSRPRFSRGRGGFNSKS
ncbi:unnamed protein product, partial [Mesorhabditis belari]|uniref:Uncharacterized protein n=1 Tax=Mesorhabditis belari TaxID=2138241 RepID=A0AAF3EMS9_9BILA